MNVETDGRVYRIEVDTKRITKLDSGIRFSNGIAFGRDNNLYVNETLTGMVEPRSAALHLIERGFHRVIVTLGASGALCADRDGMRIVPPFPVNAVDTTGAGDAFIGSLAVFLAEGHPEEHAVSRANLYAALSTTAPGTQKSFVTRERFESEWTVSASIP